MPTKLDFKNAEPRKQIAALRAKLKPDEGMDMAELSRKIHMDPATCGRICTRLGWAKKIFHAGHHRLFLVNH